MVKTFNVVPENPGVIFISPNTSNEGFKMLLDQINSQTMIAVVDKEDKTLLNTALRETEEEIYLSPNQIQVLGSYFPLPDKSLTISVTPYIGFIKELPLKINYNKDEVDSIFIIPINDLIKPGNYKTGYFRDTKIPMYSFKTLEIDQEIWGLTSYFLYYFLKDMLLWNP
jgi:hypothetical protein